MVGEVLLQAVPVRFAARAQRLQGAQLTGEAQQAVLLAPPQGLHAEAVAGQQQLVLLRIVDRQREEAVELVQEGFALHGEEAQHHFGVGAAAEGVAGRLELRAQLLEVEDLAVEGDGVTAAIVGEGLVPRRAGVDDAQAAMAQHGVPLAVGAFIIRAAMRQAGQRFADAVIDRGPAAAEVV